MMPSNQNQVPIAPGMVPIANQNVPSPSNSNMVPIGAPVSSIPGPNMVPVNPAPGAIPQTISNPPPQQAPSSSHQNNQQQQAQQHDLPRLKNLICFLKESLINLLKVTTVNIAHNFHVDNNGAKTMEENLPRIDKALEDFYAVCNQVELCLRTILECSIQTRDSNNYLPFLVSKDIKPDPNQETTLSYPQYLSVIKKQVNFAKTIYDILSEGAKQIKQSEPTIQQQQQPAAQHHNAPGQMQMPTSNIQ